METRMIDTDRLERLEECVDATKRRLDATERRLRRAERRGRVMLVVGIASVIGASALGAIPEAGAQFGITLTSLHNRLLVVEQKTAPISVSGDDFKISGKNVHIVDGSEQTQSATGRGNLTIGYNEVRGVGDTRTGSHNLILGERNNYSSDGGVVAGSENGIGGALAVVVGGNSNVATGSFSVVSGGTSNQAAGSSASVSGGLGNRAIGEGASVSGGNTNLALGNFSVVSGGSENQAHGVGASVSGGAGNAAFGQSSSVSGGAGRQVAEIFDWRAGSLFQTE